MGSKPKTPKEPTPDPATTSSSTDEQAKRETELRRRNGAGYYSAFRRSNPTDISGVGGSGNQTVG